jgi:flavin prenyltransferase
VQKKIILGISGASGVIYGIETLRALKNANVETHLIISEAGMLNIRIETDHDTDEVLNMADYVHDNQNLAASISSGSFIVDGMIVAPCTIKTLSGIANSYCNNLLVRAADVRLKENQKLLLMVRETPLHKGHLQLMLKAADFGATILPPVPAFYHQPKTISDLINQTIGKMMDYFQIKHQLFERWQGERQ